MNNKYLFSICVPTYNHSKLLEDLLNSIKIQEFKNYEIIIVNDGSTDTTDQIIKEWMSLDLFPINYIYQKNTGRASALKKAILNATGEYTIIMDSDDYFYFNAFKTISIYLNKITKNTAGICGLCSNKQDELIGSKFPKNKMYSNLLEIRADYNVKGDKKEVIRTDLLKKYMYDFDISIRRVPTSILWTRISQEHKTLFINSFLIYKDYLPQGLTKNINKVRAKNAISSAQGYYEQFNQHNISYKNQFYKYKVLINYWRYYFHGGKKEKLKFVYYFFALIGILFYLKEKLNK